MSAHAIRPAAPEHAARRCCCCSRLRCSSQRRVVSLVNLLALQGALLCVATLLLAWRTGESHLYLSAALTLALKVIFLPWLLHRLIRRLEVYWDTEPLLNIAGTMLVGLLVVVFAFGLAQPISALASTATRNAIGIAVAVILLAFLTMITRRKAMSQVVGFLSMENGLFFGAMSATYGMPMIVELGVALDVLVADAGARRVLLPDPRAVRQPRSASSRIAEGASNSVEFVCCCSAYPLARRDCCSGSSARGAGRPSSMRRSASAPSSPPARSLRA